MGVFSNFNRGKKLWQISLSVLTLIKKDPQQYAAIEAVIKKISTAYWNKLDSTYIIDAEKTVSDIKDLLSPYFVEGDMLLIIELTQKFTGKGFSKEQAALFKKIMNYS